jgi:mycothiol synthase
MQYTLDSGAAALRLNPHLSSTLLIDFLTRRGFALERYFWGMRLPAAPSIPSAELPSGFTVRSYQPGQDEQLVVEAINGSFAQHYDHVPVTAEQVRGWNERPNFKSEGLLLAFHEGALAGVCLSTVGTTPVEGDIVGDIHSLGTLPAYRRYGLGRALLLLGINYLRQFAPIVELGVEGKNEKALSLYQSVGFRQQRGWANMLKTVAGKQS